jgi:putative DNA primase/helicase
MVAAMSEAERGAPGSWQYTGWWKDGQLDLNTTRARLPANDRDAAQVMADEMAGQLHYVETSPGRPGQWYIWDGRCHRPDDSGRIKRLVTDYADRTLRMLREARQLQAAAITVQMAGSSDRDIEAAITAAWKPWEPGSNYHHGLQRSTGHNSMRSMLAGLVQCSKEHLADRWPEYLNCANGVVCLRTGRRYRHNPQWMMTYCLDVDYVPGARGPGWGKLTWHVAGENPNVHAYLLRMLGYSMLGDNREQLIFFLNGKTGSGKSQVCEAVGRVLKPVSHPASGSLISRSAKGERHSRTETSLDGIRYAWIDESAERVRIDEGQLKRVTGAGEISVSPLYSTKETEVKVSWTLWQPTNEMPTLPGFDDAIRRRVRLIPCGAGVPEGEQIKKLGELLAATEAEAILASLVAGCVDYFAGGEQRPAEVDLASAEYEAEQDTVATFRSDCVQDLPGWQMNGSGRAEVSQADMYRAYVAWCQETRTSGLGKHPFNRKFESMPGIWYDPGRKRYLDVALVPGWTRNRQES